MNDMNKQMHYVLYHVDDSDVSVNAVIQNDSIWITQKAMAELFGCTSDNISSHLKNIYSEGELIKEATTEKISVVQKEGSRNVKRNIDFYNLDAIISVGYRVNSRQATKFRIWATGVLKEYMIKGFVLDDERLKQGETVFGKDYFKELLERVRSIRASERRIWQQITDIFAECSIDYDKKFRCYKTFLFHSTEQISLCDNRTDGSGNCLFIGRQGKRKYGSYHMEKFSRRTHPEI